MDLGAFSISLSVKNLQASAEFYRKLGFIELGGVSEQNWLIMKNGNCVIGLFQGMFEGNILTFNPGWDQNAQNLEQFQDIRQIKEELESNDLGPIVLDHDRSSGPASFTLRDPDGNMILIDQHR